MKLTKPYIEDVYEVVKLIPKGRVCSYGAIATYLNLPSPRMVGWALRHSFTEDNIPAHRVLNSKGELSGRGFFNPPALMQQLLENEGIKVENDQVTDFKNLFWNPLEELF